MPIDVLIGAASRLKGAATAVKGAATSGKAGAASADVPAFTESLGKMLEGVEQTQEEANTAVAGMVDKSTEVHDAMIAMQRAEMALQLTVQVRNKLVQAYQDIMR